MQEKIQLILKLLMKKLSSKKIKTILVEGGGTVNWEFIKNNLFNELIVTLSPFLIGGNDSTLFCWRYKVLEKSQIPLI